jgi:hypothetical protein
MAPWPMKAMGSSAYAAPLPAAAITILMNNDATSMRLLGMAIPLICTWLLRAEGLRFALRIFKREWRFAAPRKEREADQIWGQSLANNLRSEG